MGTADRRDVMPAEDVRTFLGMPTPRAPEEAQGYRRSAPSGLEGHWVGAFAQALYGPAVVSPWQATFSSNEGHASDRYGRATLTVVAIDGAYVEFTKVYQGTGHTFRYRGELEGNDLVGYWEAPGTQGVFALTRTDSEPADGRAVPLRRRLGGWMWIPALVIGALASARFQSAVPPGVVASVVILFYALVFVVPMVLAHGALIRRVKRALEAIRRSPLPTERVRVATAAEPPRADDADDAIDAPETEDERNRRR